MNTNYEYRKFVFYLPLFIKKTSHLAKDWNLTIDRDGGIGH